MSASQYRLVRQIATGGMAEVFLAIQQGLGGFEKLVVVKRILPHLCRDSQFIQMFLDEARLAAALNHPNIVEIYDIQRDEDGFFIVMEYLSGEDILFLLRSLSERGDSELIPVPVICHVASHAAAGLAAAHGALAPDGTPRQVVHRDVSPGNVIVTYEGLAKLVDFGVAKANVANVYTRPGAIKGKLGYTSPEQVQHLDLDGRSDLFSLGVVTWQMLTGRRLFSRHSQAGAIRAVMEQEIPPPSELNPEVPHSLDRVVLGCLERDREERIQGAAELSALLELVGKENGWGVTGRQVGEWMQAAFPERYSERQEMERQVTLEARESSTPKPSAALKPLFPGDPVSGTPSMTLSPVPHRPRRYPVGLIVSVSVAITVVLIGLVVAVAFWLGSQSRKEEQAGAAPPALLAPDQPAVAAAPDATPTPDAAPSDLAALDLAPDQTEAKKKPRRRRKRPAVPRDGPAVPAPTPAPAAPAPAPAAEARPKATHGSLSVTADAPAYLFIDGENTGKTTPVKVRLPVGNHEVVVLFKGTNTQVKQQVKIKPGKLIKIRLRGTR